MIVGTQGRRTINKNLDSRSHTCTYVRTYVRSILLSVRARSWAHGGLNNKTRIHTRATIGGRRGASRGRGRPCGAHKASPRLISLSSSHPARSPRHAMPRHSRGPKTRGQYQGSSPRGSIVPPSLPPSRGALPRSLFILPSFRRPVRQVCARPGQARSWPCTTARSSVRPPRPAGAARRGGRCIAPRQRRCSVVGHEKVFAGFQVSLDSRE